MGKRLVWIARWVASLVVVALATVFVVRAVDSQRGAPLELWHTLEPKELSRAELDRASFADYLAAEDRLFAQVLKEVTDKLPPRARVPYDRYYALSPIFPARFAQDFNRSFVIEPEGPARGVAVLLHGLTDSPYSLRHVARRYAALGFLAISIRLPGHGLVPGALMGVDHDDWRAATRLAVREAKRRVPDGPFHLVGYSNGGALALMHALDALDDPALGRPDKIVLVSPMVGVTAFARFAGVAGWPAIFPAFAKAAWLSIIPEFNPFKYNSFPVHAARQSWLLTQALNENMRRHLKEGVLAGLPPVLTFQSVLDHTVSTRAVIEQLHRRLPDNGSELVLFDINRDTAFEQLLTVRADTALDRLLPPAPRPFRVAVVANAAADSAQAEVRETPAHATEEVRRTLGAAYPRDVYSLSHVAVPFPLSDGLYGLEPDPKDAFGISLGNIAARGEYGALVVNVDMLVRMSSNPFFPYLLERVEAGIAPAR